MLLEDLSGVWNNKCFYIGQAFLCSGLVTGTKWRLMERPLEAAFLV